MTTAITDRDAEEHSTNDPLYENSAGQEVTPVGPQRPRRRRKPRDEESKEVMATSAEKRESMTICRSVSFLQKKSYQECFNGAIDPVLRSSVSTANDKNELKEGEKRIIESGGPVALTTDGVEWEFQDLSLYLGSYRQKAFIGPFNQRHLLLRYIANRFNACFLIFF